MNVYAALLLVSVTLHVSTKYPTPKDPEAYGLNTCSGVFIGPNDILTAAHCVSRSRGHQWIRTSDNQSFEVTLEKIDVMKDLALLKIKDKDIRHKYARLGSPVEIRDPVFTVNSGEDISGTWNQGIVNNVFTEPEYKVLSIMHTASILQGASGSGLFNEYNELIGINTAKLGPFGLAVDLYEINAFLGR